MLGCQSPKLKFNTLSAYIHSREQETHNIFCRNPNLHKSNSFLPDRPWEPQGQPVSSANQFMIMSLFKKAKDNDNIWVGLYCQPAWTWARGLARGGFACQMPVGLVFICLWASRRVPVAFKIDNLCKWWVGSSLLWFWESKIDLVILSILWNRHNTYCGHYRW